MKSQTIREGGTKSHGSDRGRNNYQPYKFSHERQGTRVTGSRYLNLLSILGDTQNEG